MSPLWQSASGEPFPPPEGTPEVARAADQAIHLKTHSWEAGTRVAAAVWYTLHQSPPLLPIMGTHTTLMSGCSITSGFCLIGYIKIKVKLLTIDAFAANKFFFYVMLIFEKPENQLLKNHFDIHTPKLFRNSAYFKK